MLVYALVLSLVLDATPTPAVSGPSGSGATPIFITAAIGLLGTVVAGWLAYSTARRKTSGTVDTTEAETLWAESQVMRSELRLEVVGLRNELAALRAEAATLREEVGLIRSEAATLRAEALEAKSLAAICHAENVRLTRQIKALQRRR